MKKSPITATIINIGTELTEGLVQDLHGRFISSQLNELGIVTSLIFQIPDDYELLVKLIKENLNISDILILTGGLGPTSDDISREAISSSLALSLDFNDDLWQKLLIKYPFMAKVESNKKQAYIPAGFSVIENKNGTAPGLKYLFDNKLIYLLPGPPREMRAIFLDKVIKDLKKAYSIPSDEKMVCTSFLIGESLLEDTLLKYKIPNVTWSTRVEDKRIVFILRGGTRDERMSFFNKIKEDLGSLHIKKGEVDIALSFYNILKDKKKTFACAESCTGGLVAELMTDIPGSSLVFWGGLTVYSYESKSLWLDVPQELLEEDGAVSEKVVKLMSESLLKKSGVDVSLAVSGIAGPGGGSEEKPVGTVCFSVTINGKTISKTEHFRGSRAIIRKKAAIFSILLCQKYLIMDESLDSNAKS